jgi:hypothetical protein
LQLRQNPTQSMDDAGCGAGRGEEVPQTGLVVWRASRPQRGPRAELSATLSFASRLFETAVT